MAGPKVIGSTLGVEGLDELRRELKRLESGDLSGRLKDANRKVAELVVGRAETRARMLGRQAAAAAESLKAARQAARAVVSLGSARVPFALGAEFGARRNRERRTDRGPMLGWNQFPEWTGSGAAAGRFLYPTIRDSQRDVEELYMDELDAITADAFPD